MEEHGRKVSIGDRNIINLRFPNDIDALAEEKKRQEAFIDSLNNTCTRYKMEIILRGKPDFKQPNCNQREIKVKVQKPEVLSWIAQTNAVLTKMRPIWRDKNKSFGSVTKLMRPLIISIFLYACESWTLTAELGKRTQSLRRDATEGY